MKLLGAKYTEKSEPRQLNLNQVTTNTIRLGLVGGQLVRGQFVRGQLAAVSCCGYNKSVISYQTVFKVL